MAMTLRLTPEDEKVLAQLAEEQGISRQEATIRAIHEVATRRNHKRDVDEAARRALKRYGDLIDRLGQ